MKIFLLFTLLLTSVAHAGTCSSISRTNAASLSVLTSTKYNSDLNTVYTATNAFDGGCVSSGTLEYDSLNTTQFAPLLKAVKEGCKVSYSNASTISIGKCLAAVNGSYVYTTSATTASFGCSGCSSEVASTTYYAYIQTGSSATTLTPLISTTAPNEDGYDNSGNKVLARFYNNASSDIDTYSIDQWRVNSFVPTNSGWIDAGTLNISGTTSNPSKGTTAIDKMWARRNGKDLEVRFEYRQTGAGSAGSGDYLFEIPRLSSGLNIDTTKVTVYATVEGVNGWATNNVVGGGAIQVGGDNGFVFPMVYDSTRFRLGYGYVSSSNTTAIGVTGSAAAAMSGSTIGYIGTLSVPIAGWND